jgi:uncharacterized cupredoxin-like copper-binding protein
MSLVAAGNAAIAVVLVYFIVGVVLPLGERPFTATLVTIMSVFVTMTTVIAILAGAWGGARRRPWFWLVATLPAVVLFLQNLGHISNDITHPAETGPFLVTIGVLAGVTAVFAGGIAAFVEVLRGRVTWARFGRVAWIAAAVIGLVLGAGATSLVAGAATPTSSGVTAAGRQVAGAPTTAATLGVADFRFGDSDIQMGAGEVLGLFVTNTDDTGHSFDIDSLDIHVALPANATTVVTIHPAGPGTLDFYCAIPGHRAAGMAGSITVGA